MKRLHLDSSTPSLEKQQTKKPRNTQVQTETYKEAVFGIKMTIIHRHHPDVKLDQTQAEMIQTKRLIAVDTNPQDKTTPQFCALNLHWEYSGSSVQMNHLRPG